MELIGSELRDIVGFVLKFKKSEMTTGQSYF